MFSLIISIIAIALVAALALASIYYGGAAFQEGSTDAEASTVVNQGQQIQGAATLADVDEKFTSGTTDMDALVTGEYIKEVPHVRDQPWTLKVIDGVDVAEVAVENADICLAIEQQRDSSATTVGAAVSAKADIKAFGCSGAAGSEKAYYKL